MAGNPFRPWPRRPPVSPEDHDDELDLIRWRLVPEVRRLAEAAYEERNRNRRCPSCDGSGVDQRESTFGDCPVCRGNGSIDDGTLDPFRLALLADRLLEEGCTERDCEICGGHGWTGKISLVSESRNRPRRCDVCKGTGRCHPLLAHLRDPGLHVRGCWALDRLLDREQP